MLRLIVAVDTKSAQRTEAGIDAVDRARLRGERFHEFAAAADQWTRLVGERTGIFQRSNRPDFGDGELVSVEFDHGCVNRRHSTINYLNKQAPPCLLARSEKQQSVAEKSII